MLNSFIQLSMLGNVNSGLQKISWIKKAVKKKNQFKKKSSPTPEILHLHGHMLNYLIPFSSLENVNRGLRQILGMIKPIGVAIVIKLMKNFIFNSYMLIYLAQISIFEKGNFHLRKMSRIRKAIYVISSRTSETSHLNCYILIYLIQFSIHENFKGGLQKFSRIRKKN